LEAWRADETRHDGSGSARSGDIGGEASVGSMTTEALMTSPGEASGAARLEPISPELVLVDPRLRDLVLRSESDPSASEAESCAYEPTGSWPFPAVTPRIAAARAPMRSEAEPAAVVSTPARRRWWPLGLAAVCGSLATFALGFAIESFVDVGGTRSAPSTTETSASTIGRAATSDRRAVPPVPEAGVARKTANDRTAPSEVPGKTRGKSSETPPPRRFAWPPAPGATSYEVAVYRGDVPVFRARTTRTSIVIPERTKQSRSSRLLVPGTYKWYVWPVRKGRPASVALVRSTFVVRGR
jgi:hypothetical protein